MALTKLDLMNMTPMQVRERYAVLRKAKDDFLADAKPLYDKQRELRGKIQPLEDELRIVNREVAAKERPRLVEIDMDIALLARVMQNMPKEEPAAV